MSRVLPILFNAEMVRAILRKVNPKTATRRVIKGFIPDDAIWGYTVFTPKGYISCRGTFSDGYGEKFFKLPCQPGDILYVRETWDCMPGEFFGDTTTETVYFYKADGEFRPVKRRGKWYPSIHMPKEAARIWLKVTNVRVERLQEITEEQLRKEGFIPEVQGHLKYKWVWDGTIKKSDLSRHGWVANPWVWVIEFERCEKPEGKE